MRVQTLVLILLFLASVAAGYFTNINNKEQFSVVHASILKHHQHTEDWYNKRVTQTHYVKAEELAQRGCLDIELSFAGDSCPFSEYASCTKNFAFSDFAKAPRCMDYGVGRVATPEKVKGIYVSSLAVGHQGLRDKLMALVRDTEINTVVVDIKEVDGYTGTYMGSREDFPFQKNLMGDVRAFIEELHKQEVYVIGRVVFFKDKAWAEAYPEHAVLRKDDTTRVWTDYKDKKFIDPGAEEFWNYLVELSSAAYQMGFDEIQADYIRFPSDGNMSNTYYPYSEDYTSKMGGQRGRVHSLTRFMKYYSEALRTRHPDIVLSADVFGMVSTNDDDLTIGQKLEPFLVHFDHVSPMVYPSHYPINFLNLEGHPDNHPYEVIYHSQHVANKRREYLVGLQKQFSDVNVSRTEQDSIQKEWDELTHGGDDTLVDIKQASIGTLRPWLQDFTCTWCKGYFPYGAEELREQIDASNDAGDSGWLLWNAANLYTREGLIEE